MLNAITCHSPTRVNVIDSSRHNRKRGQLSAQWACFASNWVTSLRDVKGLFVFAFENERTARNRNRITPSILEDAKIALSQLPPRKRSCVFVLYLLINTLFQKSVGMFTLCVWTN